MEKKEGKKYTDGSHMWEWKKLPRLILNSGEEVIHAPGDTRHDWVSEYAQGVDVLLSEHAQSCILPPSEGTRFERYIGNTCVSSGLLSKRCTIVHFGGGRPQRKPFGSDDNHNSDTRRAVPVLCYIVEGQVCKILITKLLSFQSGAGLRQLERTSCRDAAMFSATRSLRLPDRKHQVLAIQIKIITQNTLSRFNIFVYIHILHI